MEQEAFVVIEPREFDRQDVINAVVRARGTHAGGAVNQDGLDWDIANAFNELGYKVISPVSSSGETPTS